MSRYASTVSACCFAASCATIVGLPPAFAISSQSTGLLRLSNRATGIASPPPVGGGGTFGGAGGGFGATLPRTVFSGVMFPTIGRGSIGVAGRTIFLGTRGFAGTFGIRSGFPAFAHAAVRFPFSFKARRFWNDGCVGIEPYSFAICASSDAISVALPAASAFTHLS